MIVGRASAASAARPERLWEVLVDGRRWGAWNDGIAWLVFEGPCAPGSYVTIKPQHGRQTAYHVDVAEAPRRFAIGLRFGPLAALHLSWSIAEEAGGARIDHEIAIDGPLAGLLVRGMAQRALATAPNNLAQLARLAAK
jgi:hypothetical protein